MKKTIAASALALVFGCPAASAHHSREALYDTRMSHEIEGEITRVLWRNPHVRFWIKTDTNGEQASWEVESTPPGILERHGIGPEVLIVGQKIRVAGAPARNDRKAMDATNILLPGGVEVLINRRAEPRWSDESVGWAEAKFSEAEIQAAEARSNGIFRIWSRDFKSGVLPGRPDYPLTEAAQLAEDAYDPIADSPVSGCTPKGMPYIMAQPYPVEFIDEGDRILLRIEEYDLTRIIHMADDLSAGSGPTTPLGYSFGRWDGANLVVLTSAILSPYLDDGGIMLSNAARIEEHFTLSQDETRLDYRMTVTDAATFTEPVIREKFWLWRPGETVKPFECVE
jgi:hypothetical protein